MLLIQNFELFDYDDLNRFRDFIEYQIYHRYYKDYRIKGKVRNARLKFSNLYFRGSNDNLDLVYDFIEFFIQNDEDIEDFFNTNTNYNRKDVHSPEAISKKKLVLLNKIVDDIKSAKHTYLEDDKSEQLEEIFGLKKYFNFKVNNVRFVISERKKFIIDFPFYNFKYDEHEKFHFYKILQLYTKKKRKNFINNLINNTKIEVLSGL